ncbi:MAG: transcription-repair coupling factor [Burkholderiaceae bacterium]
MTTSAQAQQALLSPLALYGQALPKPGQSIALPRPHGSADSLLLAGWLCEFPVADARVAGAGGLLVAPDAQTAARLAAEIPYFCPGRRVSHFSDWETLAYEAFSPHQDLLSNRLLTLYEALQGSLDLLVVAAPTLLQRVAPPAFLAANTFFIKPGQTISLDRLREQLRTAGYNAVSQVVSPGEYALRGGLVDLYPMGSSLPYRIELLDDQVDSVRVFDPDSQRTIHPVQEIRLLPGREYPRDEASAMRLRARWRETFEGDPSRCSLYRDAANGVFGAGIEYYLPLLFDEPLVSLLDYLHPQAQIALVGEADPALQEATRDLHTRYEFLRHDIERPVLPPSALYLAPDELFAQMGRWGRISLHRDPSESLTLPAPDIRADRRADAPLTRLTSLLEASAEAGERIALVAETPGRLETLAQYLERESVATQALADWATLCASQPDHVSVLTGVSPIQVGFVAPWLGLTVLTESELFADMERRKRHGKQDKQTNVDAIIRDLSELKPGDPVVHLQHGIGRYQGLQHLDLGEGETECLHLAYAGGSSLFVPVSQLHLIGRYSGADPDQAPLHSLGSGQWDKARAKAAKHVRDTAAELLNLYARRAARVGHSFRFEPSDYERFADGFGFEETPDQLAAIHAVVQDMVRDKPMDRLVCGDVGFGKTEVALRAAFIAVMDGRQVAVLCPTTLLAEQHMQTFQDRFSSWPVRLAELSRFRSAKEIAQALGGMASGQVDIVIGTHKILSAQTQFNRLGLVIIDEEHRFGVRQKEALKNLRAEVDVLTLTATPIPRTLAMSLEGIRDFSVIATAPQKRLSIKTFVRRESPSTVREALLRELKRGGQAYVLHNEVNTMQHRLEALQALVPEARFGVAHGQMDERDLERVMRDFHQQRINVLLCTTIIETGINVPTANTMVIYRADRFGLAQLHQLRGRVGRSHHQAYAYLMVPDEQTVTKDAAKRLDAIQSMEELGSGFFLAMHDMEIRGAGEVLGDNQSGDMTEVGFQLYNDMLTEAVSALKAGREPDMDAPLKATTEINLHLPALLPADYCGDIHERLSLYKRLASAATNDELDDLQEELIDRFGKLPDAARALVETHRLRLRAQSLGIRKLDASHEHIGLQFRPEASVDPARVITILQRDPRFKLAGPDRIRMAATSEDLTHRMVHIREALTLLFPVETKR